MESPRMEVKCSVVNCHYNKQRMCYADKLEVNGKHGSNASSSDDTCCTTFVEHN